MTIPTIRPGVFFTPRSDLPRGRHALDRDQVSAVQRERLMAAFTELIAAHGLTAVTVADVVGRARVSRAAFYSCFDDLGGCADAAYERFIAVLIDRLTDALAQASGDWEATIEETLRAYLDALVADPVVARAMQLEMDAAGRPARLRRQAALRGLADTLAARHAEAVLEDPTARPLPDEAFLAVVYAVRQLACDALDSEDDPDLPALVDPLVQWIGALIRVDGS